MDVSAQPESDSSLKTAPDDPSLLGTVLLVSDDNYFRSTMRAYLEHAGIPVRSCADAARVPELFFHGAGPGSSPGSSVDLLLIDVHAMGLTGLRLAAELTGFKPDLPVVVISAPDPQKAALARIARRGWKFLNKPVLLPELLGVIHSALETRRRAGRPGKASGMCGGAQADPATAATGDASLHASLQSMKARGRVQ